MSLGCAIWWRRSANKEEVLFMGKSKNNSLVKNMLIAVALGFIIGIACLFIKQAAAGSSA